MGVGNKVWTSKAKGCGNPNNFTNLNKGWHGAVQISEVLLYYIRHYLQLQLKSDI